MCVQIRLQKQSQGIARVIQISPYENQKPCQNS